MSGNAGEGVTKAAEQLYRGVREAFRLPDPVWIEHHPPEATDEATETFELVVFSPGGRPRWKPLDRASVEAIIGRTLARGTHRPPPGLP